MAHEVTAPLTGTIWKIVVNAGDSVESDTTVVIMESMKMEVPVEAGEAGTVEKILVKEAQPVNEGQVLVTVRTS